MHVLKYKKLPYVHHFECSRQCSIQSLLVVSLLSWMRWRALVRQRGHRVNHHHAQHQYLVIGGQVQFVTGIITSFYSLCSLFFVFGCSHSNII